MFPELELREGWATVALLFVMLFCVVWSIQAVEWTHGLSILQGVILLATATGIVLAKSRVPNRMAHMLSILGGFTWSAFLTSRVLAGVTGASGEAAAVELEKQLRVWLGVVFTGGTSPGNYIFLLLLAVLLWLVAYFSAWSIFRWQLVWGAVIVSGIAVMINAIYANVGLTGYLLAFLLSSLLLVVRTSVAFYEQEWRTAQVGYSPELVYTFLRAGLVVSIVAILLAWVAPDTMASRPMQEIWARIGEPWRRLQEQSSRVFQDLNYRNQPAFISFGRSMKFGGPVDLSDAPIMDVEAPSGRYWRVMAFHDYTSDGWDNTDVDTIEIDENEDKLVLTDSLLRREVTQTITLKQSLGPAGTIAAAGQPLRSGLPLRAVVSYVEGEGESAGSPEMAPLPPLPGDASALYSRVPLNAEDSYQVVSSLTTADEESLRQAGDEFPTWIAPRYLQLPDSFPRRVRLLAEQIAADRESPYDKAKAIERYLRDVPYNELIEGPRSGQDGVDYFLFDAREGYCDYYASAMVVMLRAVGVPARYVRGYSQAFKDEGAYRILEKDGHAWPEVFFPGYGWVEFEPTAGEPTLSRPRSQDDVPGGAGDRDRQLGGRDLDEFLEDPFGLEDYGPFPEPTPQPLWQRVGRWGVVALMLVLSGFVVMVVLMFRRHDRIEGLTLVERVYAELVDLATRLLKVGPLAHQTPNEYGATVVDAVPASRQPVERIVEYYVGYRFGGRAGDDGQAEEAWQETRRIFWKRWLQRQGERLTALPRRLLPVAFRRREWTQRQP